MKPVLPAVLFVSVILASGSGWAGAPVPAIAEIDTLLLLEDLVEAGELDDPDLLETVYTDLQSWLTGSAGEGQVDVSIRRNSRRFGVVSRSRHHVISADRRSREDDPTASLMVSMGGVRLGYGQLTVRQGFGLLAAGTGRRSPVSAAVSLLPPRGGWRGYRGTPDARSLDGYALTCGAGRLEACVLRGRRVPGRDATDLLSVGLSGRAADLEIMLLEQDVWRGGSLYLRLGTGRDRVCAEISSRFEAGRKARQPNAALAFSRGLGRMTVSGLYVATTGGTASPLAQRPSAIGDWGGRGWALRTTIRLDAGFRVNLLAAGSVDPLMSGSAYGTQAVRRLEVGLDRRWTCGLSLCLRLRSKRESTSGWADRSAWNASAWQQEIGKYQIQGRLDYDLPQGRLRLANRYLKAVKNSIGAGYEPDDRSLLTLEYTAWPGARMRFHCSLDRAWGGTADLCSVDVPVSGIMTPLHWGHWRDGVSLGLEYRADRLRCGLSLRTRSPEADDSRPIEQDAAFRAGFYW